MAALWLRLNTTGRRMLARSMAAEGSVRHCSESAALQEKSSNLEVAEENILIPRKKTWDKLAVLQALASTVKRDATAANYTFLDDPYLIPRNLRDFRLFHLSKESGKNVAKFVINTDPKYFQKDIAEPHIPSFMPRMVELQPEEVSEDALRSLVLLRKVKASVDMYDQLQQAGTTISLESSNSLLDLLCFYGDREDSAESSAGGNIELEELQEPLEEKGQKGNWWDPRNSQGIKWRETNNAERIFKLMPEKDAHSFCTMIRGMVKHGAYENAVSMYTELLNNRFNADVYTFNALILTAGAMKDKSLERWEIIEDLLKQMVQQNVQPNLLTFNSVLKVLKLCGIFGRGAAMHTLNEMKALNIEPSLATFDHLLNIFYRRASFSQNPSEIIYDVLNEIEGKSYYPRDPDDVNFFSTAMRICLNLKDVQLAYQLNRILETGENRKMIGDHFNMMSYWGRFFNLLCTMEQIDVVLKWYKELVPSVLYLTSKWMLGLLQALDTANQLEMIPQIWKDNKGHLHNNKSDTVEELLALMARDTHSLETQTAFADCAADIKSLHETQESKENVLEWTSHALNHITILFARAGRSSETWTMLKLFKNQNRIPSDFVMNEVLSCIKQENQAEQAFDLVKLASSFSLTSTSDLARRVLEEFQLSEDQKRDLADMAGESDSE